MFTIKIRSSFSLKEETLPYMNIFNHNTISILTVIFAKHFCCHLIKSTFLIQDPFPLLKRKGCNSVFAISSTAASPPFLYASINFPPPAKFTYLKTGLCSISLFCCFHAESGSADPPLPHLFPILTKNNLQKATPFTV